MTNILTQFASTEAAQGGGDIFVALGIDWKMLILQIVAFLILVALLGKFVYPWLMKSVDERQEAIDASTKAAENAQKKAEEAEANVAKALKVARTEAADIVATAKAEATAMAEEAESRAKSRSERIVAEAQEEISKEIIAAKKALEKETLSLVKTAASLAVSGVADDKLDENVIKKAIEGAKR